LSPTPDPDDDRATTAGALAPARPSAAQAARAFLELGKLRLSLLAVFAVLAGLWMGEGTGPRGASVPVWAVAAGTLLVAVGGNALNMLLEREHDQRMARTAGRPLPTGRLQPRQVLAFGLGAGLAGVLLLAWCTNLLATSLCAAILLTYVSVYTPLKRVTTLNTLVGAIPGALPPVVGYAAAAGRVDARALVLFGIVFLWQIPHFLAIAWRYREDYRRGGMRMLPVGDPRGRATALHMVVYTMALFVVALLPPQLGMTGELYGLVAALLGVFFLATVAIAAATRQDRTMRACFLASIVYLPLLLGAMVLDRT
jgi:protoheme IX farnesyltransferase